MKVTWKPTSELSPVVYDYFPLRNGGSRKLVQNKKFDPKTFNPYENGTDRAILNTLRTTGRSRYLYQRYFNTFYPSTSLRVLLEEGMRAHENNSDVYIDFGCGESGDRFLAERLGYKSVGLDLFPPLIPEQDTSSLIISDLTELLPFLDFSFAYATCHAVIALLPTGTRARFYTEVYRCMQIGGKFVLTGADLKNGYGFDLSVERDRLLDCTEFDYIRSIPFGVLVERTGISS